MDKHALQSIEGGSTLRVFIQPATTMPTVVSLLYNKNRSDPSIPSCSFLLIDVWHLSPVFRMSSLLNNTLALNIGDARYSNYSLNKRYSQFILYNDQLKR
jgi:hypothetical protein